MFDGMMEQEKVWDVAGRPWKDFRVSTPKDVENFLAGKNGKILDVGCGSGRNFLRIDGLDWYGIDFSGVMLKYAKKHAVEKGIGVELAKGSVDELPYEDNFFDYVLFYATLHCVDSAKKRKKSLEEVFRILKSGGEVLISVWGRGSPRLKNKDKECFVPWTVRGGDEKVQRYTYIYDLEELKKDLEDVGFEIVKIWEDVNVNAIVRKV